LVAPTSAKERVYSIDGMNETEAQNFTVMMMMKYLLSSFETYVEGQI
jgi:hypothetical protein